MLQFNLEVFPLVTVTGYIKVEQKTFFF